MKQLLRPLLLLTVSIMMLSQTACLEEGEILQADVPREVSLGWGAGESGRQFMHWFQPVEERAAVAGMVNSYLHIGVERGLPVLFGWLALGSFFGTLPLIATVLDRQPETCRIRKALVTSAGSVMAVFLVANVFSTLWIFPRLWIPVVAACGLMAGGFVSGFRREIRRNLWGAAGASLLLSLFVLSAVYGTGRMLREQNPLRLQVQGAFLRLPGSSDEDSLSPPLYIVPSAEVFGEDWGKEVRRLDSSMPERKWSLVVAWKDVPENEKRPPVFSHTMDMVTSILPPPQRHVPSAVRNLLILHPQEPPPASLRFSPERVRVLLPSLDMTGTAGLWRRAAKQRGWTVANSGAFTQDIRTVWPDGVLEYIEEE